MATAATVIASLTEPVSERVLQELGGAADVLEVRADLVATLDPAWLREHFSGELLYTFRSRPEGGRGTTRAEERTRCLVEAAADFDIVDLEAARDLGQEVLDAVPPKQRLISWHGKPLALRELQELAKRSFSHAARWYKFVPEAHTSGQEIAPLAFVRSLGRRDVIAFASGTIGQWSRILALRHGAPVVFGSVGSPAALGQISVDRLREDYGLPAVPDGSAVFGVVGNPVSDSLSPRLYNRAFAEIGLDALYVPFQVESFSDFWLEVVELDAATAEVGSGLAGLSITAPAKRVALAIAGAASPRADFVGAANTLARRDRVWEAETTDPDGVLGPLRERGISLEGRRAAVLGAGGAGRAAAFGLAHYGAEVTFVNRDVGRRERAASRFGVRGLSWDEFVPGEYDVLVNATPLGRTSSDPMPVAPERLASDAWVVDMAYRRDRRTAWLEAVEEVGCSVVDGREVLLHQAIGQFQFLTHRALPVDSARAALGLPPVSVA